MCVVSCVLLVVVSGLMLVVVYFGMCVLLLVHLVDASCFVGI